MFGLRINVTCPYCKQEHIVNLGTSTGYYTINESEDSYWGLYTKCECNLCKKQYWLSHTLSEVIDVKKDDENYKLDLKRVTCW